MMGMTMISSERSILLVFVFLLLSSYTSFVLGSSSGAAEANVRCIERERRALLMVKQELIDEYGHLSSWGNEKDKRDCCKWRGVSCSKHTGHVVKLNLTFDFFVNKTYMPLEGNISPSLLELLHLNYLKLKFDYLGKLQIPEFIGSLKKLRHLDLSYAGFSGRIPCQLGNLSHLEYLDLSNNHGLYAEKLDWLSHLSSARHIRLNEVNLTKAADWLHVISGLPSLIDLQLQQCYLPSVIPSSISFVNSSKSLAHLNLSGNNISNSIYAWLSHFSSSLVSLVFTRNNLRGPIPANFFGKFCKLRMLSLERNNLTGPLTEVFQKLSGCNRDTLQELYLSYNMFSGSLPDFTQFSSLRELDLEYNKLNGTFPQTFEQPSNLTTLQLGGNQLWGSLPDFGVFPYVEKLYISNNRLNGTITEAHLLNLSRLKYMDLSFNSMAFNVSSGWIPPFQTYIMRLGACKLGPHFPRWLQTQNMLSELDISDAGISDHLPNWFWNLSFKLEFLNLSHNHISGMLPDLSQKFAGLETVIDLSSNAFEGLIPPLPRHVSLLILSKNRFSGSLSFLCMVTGENLRYVDLSDNQLSGELPSCSMQWQQIDVLNLANNRLSGKIPNSMDISCQIRSLHLRNNSLTGEFPSSLKSCTRLTIIDLGNNRFSGSIPAWLGESFMHLVVLSLPSNQFHGNIPMQLCNMETVQVLDFSQNNISGNIPGCLNNLTAMAQKVNSVKDLDFFSRFERTDYMMLNIQKYRGHAVLVWKGKDSEYEKNLGLLRIIDLSNNKLSGEIPEEMTGLVGLNSLNLSRNSLIGPISPFIGRLNLLDSLDLSNNMLTGELPESFSQLNFLGKLNLSNNNFSGRISSIIQLQKFDASSYMGNPELCGSPLPNKCLEDEPAQDPGTLGHDNEDGFITLGFYVSIVLGFIIGFWGVCGALVLNKSWRYAYFKLVDHVIDEVYVFIAVKMVNLRRKLRS